MCHPGSGLTSPIATFPGGFVCGAATAAHYPQHLDLLRALGFGACRFSIEWSWIEPEDGELARATLDHYTRVIAACRIVGPEPGVWHRYRRRRAQRIRYVRDSLLAVAETIADGVDVRGFFHPRQRGHLRRTRPSRSSNNPRGRMAA